MIITLYKVFCSALYINAVMTSYNIPNYSNWENRLKRKSENCSSEIHQVKYFAFGTTNLVENLPAKMFTSTKEHNDTFYDQVVEEYIDFEITSKSTQWETNTCQSINITSEEDKNKDRIIEELVAEMIRDENNFIPTNSQFCNNIPMYLENSKMGLLNSQTETIGENPSLGPNSEQSLIQQPLDDVSVYSYSNLAFLYLFLHFPSPTFTADSIRVRFGSGFLHFLSIDQLKRVLIILLGGDLELTKAERTELVEMIFGHIDFSFKMGFNNDQIVSIVTALMLSDVPYCFEQVFLTWKMWQVFTAEEQEKMLKDVVFNITKDSEIRIKYDRETLVMLYLFVLNRDAVNSDICEVFKERIIEMYGTTSILNDSKNLTPLEYIEKDLLFADTLDVSLLVLPGVLKNLSFIHLTVVKNFVKGCIGCGRGNLGSAYFGKRYKIHICYALTKFTCENTQSNNDAVIDIYDKIYFEPKCIKNAFNKWVKKSKDELFLNDEHKMNEFRNAYGAMLQIIQSEGYESAVFLRLFHEMCLCNFHDRLYALILFSLTKEDILRDVIKTPEWAEHMRNRSINRFRFTYIEDIFIRNIDLSLKLSKSYFSNNYIIKITDTLFDLISANKMLYRERYLYQQVLFHPKFKLFKNSSMKPYIFGLDDVRQLDNKDKRMQIARNLIFNKFYYKLTIKLKFMLLKYKGNLGEFRKCLEKESNRYKNETDLENERVALKNC